MEGAIHSCNPLTYYLPICAVALVVTCVCYVACCLFVSDVVQYIKISIALDPE